MTTNFSIATFMLSFLMAVSGTTSALTLSAGANHTCGIKESDNSVVCWGNNEKGQRDAPDGEFSQISAGNNRTCGIKTDGSVVCWGENSDQITHFDGTFSQIDVGYFNACGIRTDGIIVCPNFTLPSGSFSKIAAIESGVCGIKDDDTILCTNGYSSISGTFSQISSYGYYNNHLCRIKTDGTLACNNSGYNLHITPSGTFTQVSVGQQYACAVNTDSSVVCWGYNNPIPPNDKFAQVAVGHSHSCGIKTDGSVACWGSDDSEIITPPEDLILKIDPIDIPPKDTECPKNAVFSINEETLTLPMVEVPLIMPIGLQPTGKVQVYEAIFKLANGNTQDNFMIRKLTLLADKVESNENCKLAKYSVVKATLNIPYLEVPTVTMIGDQVFESDVEIYEMILKWFSNSGTFVVQQFNKLEE